ncbi:DUF4225 domain-containing protein [Pseudomonas sp. GM48]|uniref:DUF4225 domain-containing protein n=1 Tax=Pseudomonas sp. GM48 TaxID=1144330 RepID=UPI00027049DE|nr:hypothetical protein PMI28_01320 [Pseudomonas sp. GM48]
MRLLKDIPEQSSCDYWAVCKAAGNLSNQAGTLAARHIKDSTLRLQFNREVAYYARGIVNSVAQGNKSPEQGLKEIKNEQSSLLSQSWAVTQKGIGVIAGALQIATGGGICYLSAGTLCIAAGVPMMLHGANNVYENSRNILEERSDTEGPLRKGYQGLAKSLNRSEHAGNMAYGAFDLSLSVYGAGRMVLKPDSWRLFRHVKADYVRAYRNSSTPAFLLERSADAMTIDNLHEQWKATTP